MKRYLTLIFCGFMLMALATGCSRNNRNSQGDQPTAAGPASSAVSAQPSVAPTDIPTSAPAASATATTAAAQPTDTVAPGQATQSASSGQISSQLDDALNQLDQQLGSGDALDDTPVAP